MGNKLFTCLLFNSNDVPWWQPWRPFEFSFSHNPVVCKQIQRSWNCGSRTMSKNVPVLTRYLWAMNMRGCVDSGWALSWKAIAHAKFHVRFALIWKFYAWRRALRIELDVLHLLCISSQREKDQPAIWNHSVVLNAANNPISKRPKRGKQKLCNGTKKFSGASCMVQPVLLSKEFSMDLGQI